MSDPAMVDSDLRFFYSAWMKWVWALGHAKELKAQVDAWGEQFTGKRVVGVTAKYDNKRHGFPIVVSDFPRFHPRTGVLLGDAVHNLRSCLDHIAWGMVMRGTKPQATLPAGALRRIQFPIALTHDDFRTAVSSRLPGIRRADLARVRFHQPYVRGVRIAPTHPLNVLSELDNRDKHHAIQPVVSWPTAGRINLGSRGDCDVTRIAAIRGAGAAIEIGEELCFIRARKTGPDPRIEVEPNIVGEPAVYGRVLLFPWLQLAFTAVANLLLDLCPPPADIDTLGVDVRPWWT